MADEPTNGEVMRALAATSLRLDRMVERLDRVVEDMERRYVPRELYNVELREHARRITNIEGENEAREKDDSDRRKQYTFIAVSVALTAVGSLLVSMISLLAGGPGG